MVIVSSAEAETSEKVKLAFESEQVVVLSAPPLTRRDKLAVEPSH